MILKAMDPPKHGVTGGYNEFELLTGFVRSVRL
jgi:hypothetical protein